MRFLVKDFGQKVYRERRRHQGVVLLRLEEDERAPNKIEVLRRLLGSYSDALRNRLVVVTEERVRFGRNS